MLCDAYGLGKEARVVGEVERAGQEAALLEDVGDVAGRAGVASIDVMCTISGVVEVARVAGGGKLRVAFCTRLGMVMQWYW